MPISFERVNCLEEVVRQDCYLAGDRVRFPDALLRASGHHRAGGIGPSREQIAQICLRFRCYLGTDLVLQENSKCRCKFLRVGVNEEPV